MGQMRANWKAFKAKYPDFEKNKLFKSDLGPQADRFESIVADCLKLAEALEKKMKERDVVGKSLVSAMKGYTAVMLDLKKSDPKKFDRIEADCTFDRDGNRAGMDLFHVIQRIKANEHFNFTL